MSASKHTQALLTSIKEVIQLAKEKTFRSSNALLLHMYWEIGKLIVEDETIVKYSVLAENEKLFASKYRLYLPKEEELKQLIETDRINLEMGK